MKPIVLHGYDDDEVKIPVTVPGPKGKRVTVMLPRFDYMPVDAFNAMMGALEDLDVEQQIIAAANELASVDCGEEVPYEQLLDPTRKALEKHGVVVKRTMKQGTRRDVLIAPDQSVIDALAPFADEKPKPLPERMSQIALTMLRHALDADTYELFTALPPGALDELLRDWRARSALPLGESEASPKN